MPRIGSRGRTKRQGGANEPRAVERRAVDSHFWERHRATRRGRRYPARLRVMEAGSRGRAPEGPPPFTTPEVKPVFQSSAGPRPDEADAVVVHVLDGDKRHHQIQRRWVSPSKRQLVFQKEEAVRDRKISVLAVHGASLPLGSFSAGVRAAAVAGANRPNRGLRSSNSRASDVVASRRRWDRSAAPGAC